MDMMKNKKTLKVAVVAAVCSFIGLLIAGSNVSAQDFDSYFNGNKNATSISEFVGNIQISKANIPDIKLEIKKPEIDVVDEGGLGGNVVDSIVDTFSDSDEFVQFWDDLREDVYDDICKAVRINLSEGAEFADIVGIKGKFKRYLKQYPDKRIALIDEVHVRLTGDYSSDIFNVNDTPFNVSFNSKAEGKSIVVRRLDGVKYCDEILTMVDLRKVKTILPIRSRRILKMKPGEIWKFPLTFQIGLGGSVGHSFSGISVSLSLKSSKERKPSVTLYKMNEETLRIRVRLNRATFKSVGIAAKAFTISAGDIGLFETSNKLTEFIHDELADEIAGQFNKYLSFKLGLSHNRVKGKKILMEFLLDAQDEEQLERLEDFLRGDLGVLKKLLRMGTQFNGVDIENDLQAGADALNEVENIGEESLEAESSFVGSDHFNSNGNSLNLQVPFFYSRESASSARYDRYQTMEGDEILHSHQVSQNISNASINIPWVGKRYKRNVRQNMYIVNYEKEGSAVSEPSIIYQRYDGTVRRSELTARGMVEDVNDILQYAGVNGEGVNSDYTIDTDTLFPKLSEAENNPQYDEDGFIRTTHMVSMRDGIKLATDVYLPIAQNKPHGSIFLRTPYNKDDLYELGVGIALLGWPVIIQDIRGMHASEGAYEGYRKCQVDGPDSLAWIASQDWSNGKVSTVGPSALGITQYFTAGANPPELACQGVMVATPNLHKHAAYQGGEFRKSLVEKWLDGVNAEYLLEEIFENENSSGDTWINVTLEDNWEDVNVPAIHIGGWYDIFLQG
ncbi:MAG: CocE/NonD family hydrolase, partial [Elusimicrobiales bacterium]|nr:CocE/NonD family hydrolase [Elusimicrobiales bacterium]